MVTRPGARSGAPPYTAAATRKGRRHARPRRTPRPDSATRARSGGMSLRRRGSTVCTRRVGTHNPTCLCLYRPGSLSRAGAAGTEGGGVLGRQRRLDRRHGAWRSAPSASPRPWTPAAVWDRGGCPLRRAASTRGRGGGAVSGTRGEGEGGLAVVHGPTTQPARGKDVQYISPSCMERECCGRRMRTATQTPPLTILAGAWAG